MYTTTKDDKEVEAVELALKSINLEISKNSFYDKKFSIIKINSVSDNQIKGTEYKIGKEPKGWAASPTTMPHETYVSDCYLKDEVNFFNFLGSKEIYNKISPFIYLGDDDDDVFIFQSIKDTLTKQISHYNIIKNSGEENSEWPQTSPSLWQSDDNTDDNRVKTVSGVIKNKYRNNYNSYYDIGRKTLRNEIFKFFESKHFPILTLWGHGGIGKTALIQNICDELSDEAEWKRRQRKRYNKQGDTFDYIIFT